MEQKDGMCNFDWSKHDSVSVKWRNLHDNCTVRDRRVKNLQTISKSRSL